MSENLIGPFPATTHPVRAGVYKVLTPHGPIHNKYAYWSTKHGWSLCGMTVKSAHGERRDAAQYEGLSSMYGRDAVWWGSEQMTTKDQAIAPDSLAEIFPPRLKPAPDCRTCEFSNIMYDGEQCNNCTNGDQRRPISPSTTAGAMEDGMIKPDPSTLCGAWYYIYGAGSHMNMAGKIILGIPLFPLFATFVLTWWTMDKLFTKKALT